MFLSQQQLRWISKKRKKQLQRNSPDDPFNVLGISRTESYASVKNTFLQIAMKHHPDTSSAGTEAEREANKDVFVAARKAFEAIVAGPDGLAILKSESADYVEEENLDQWFKSETGYDMPFMDAATMKEVAEMTESVGGGLDRDGGMWTLARMVADTVKSGGDSRSLLQLETGTVRDGQIDGVLRRKRRR
jgi:DnaJ domain